MTEKTVSAFFRMGTTSGYTTFTLVQELALE
jgi:hypothetical protein